MKIFFLFGLVCLLHSFVFCYDGKASQKSASTVTPKSVQNSSKSSKEETLWQKSKNAVSSVVETGKKALQDAHKWIRESVASQKKSEKNKNKVVGLGSQIGANLLLNTPGQTQDVIEGAGKVGTGVWEALKGIGSFVGDLLEQR